MNITAIEVSAGYDINVWASPLGKTDYPKRVGLEVITPRGREYAYLTAEKTDELIRALGAVRVEISKQRPA